MQYLLAHDLGTSAVKAVLYDTKGSPVAESTASYATSYPFPGAAEQQPEAWWAAFCETTKDLLAKTGCQPGDILALSFSAQMNACLPVDQAGQALRPAMIWADQRAHSEADTLAKALGLQQVYKQTGQVLSASYALCKMAWFKAQEPELYKQTACFLQPKDFLIAQLTGRLVSDYSDASHTACLDIHSKTWWVEALQAAGISPAKMPPLLPSTAIAGKVTQEAARACGLLAGTPVVMGGGDGPCATAGAGIYAPGQSYVCLGTSAWAASLHERPYLDQEQRTFNLVFLDGVQVMALGASQTAGLALSWAADTLFSELSGSDAFYQDLQSHIAGTQAGSDGLLFLPYLLGERSPWWNAKASGCFIGLRPTHSKGHMLRAVLEGVGLNLKLILDALEGGGPIAQLTVIGGGARNPAWLAILADIWQKKLALPRHLQTATSLGAMLCAGIGAGVFKGFEAAISLNPAAHYYTPKPEQAERYKQALKRFIRLYYALDLAAFSRE